MTDEFQPLLSPILSRTLSNQSGHLDDISSEDSFLLSDDVIKFDPSGDDDNPLDWPPAYKWGIITLLAFMAFTVYDPSPPLHQTSH